MRRLAALLLACFALVQGVRLFRPARGEDGLPEDVDAQRRFVRSALDAGAPRRMQALFPEGWFFSWALYGLAEADVARARGDGAALQNARTALAALDSAEGRAAFPEQQSPPYGVFYQGWTTYLRARLVELGVDEERPALERAVDALDVAFRRSDSAWLEAYPGQAWPCDTVVALAALRVAEHAGVGDAAPVVARWRSLATVDPRTGLFPHTAHPGDEARGTSQTIILRFLPQVDRALAREQYLRFRERFVVTVAGLPAVRETLDPRPALFAAGDVDSGPLLWGVSLSASAVAIGTAEVNGDRHLGNALRHAAEVVGVPVGWSEKRYLLGAMPVADVFLLWAKTARGGAEAAPTGAPGRGWPVPSLVFDGALFAIAVWWGNRRR
jgi:hypothetical protein